MTDETDRDPGQALPEHATHDQLLIARYVADELDETEREAAAQLVAVCPACTALFSDLQSLGRALAAPPAVTRRRDFHLTAAQARELRPPTLVERLRAWRPPSAVWVQPLAGAVTVVGLALALASSGLVLPGSGSTGERGAAQVAAAPSAAPSAGALAAPALGAAPASSAAPSAAALTAPEQSAAPALSVPQPSAAAAARPSATAVPRSAPVAQPPSPAAESSGTGAFAVPPTPPGATPSGTAPPAGIARVQPPSSAAPADKSAAGKREPGSRGSPVPAWALWLGVAVVGALVFVAARRVPARRGS